MLVLRSFVIALFFGDGQVIDTWGSLTRPLAAKLTKAIEDELSKSQ